MRVQIGNGRAVPPVTLHAIATAGAPATATIIAGDAQKSTVNAPLRKPIVVRVADKLGNPVAGARVSLETETGMLADSVLTTDSSGTATVKWTMARAVGKQRLVAHVDGIERKIEATAVALPASAANLALATDVMSGIAGKVLGTPVVATVTDSYGNAVADAVVSFSARAGNVSPARVSTDSKGHAQTRWTLGRTTGEQALVAVVNGHDVRATITVQATSPEGSAKAAKPTVTKSVKPVVAKKKSTKRSR
jgi:phosphatidate phosphatase APP1